MRKKKNVDVIILLDCEEIMMEVSRREKEAGIFPDPDIDTYMKVIDLNACKFEQFQA